MKIINDPKFWESFTIHQSPPDGHCFIHSLVSSLCRQGWDISVNDVTQCIEFECFDNTSRYLPFMGEDSSLCLFQSLYDYTVNRLYNSDFVDMIPQICSNALGININIIVNHNMGKIAYRLEPCDCESVTSVFVYKSGDHYDSIFTNENVVVCNGSQTDPCSLPVEGGLGERVGSPEGVSAPPIQSTSRGNKDRNNDIASQNHMKKCFSSGVLDLTTGVGSLPLDRFGICFYNIHGLTLNKLSDDLLGSFFKSFSLILLCETWLDKSQTDEFDVVDQYSFFNFARKFKHPNAIRGSGGLGVYVHKSFQHGIEFTRSVDDIVTTMKIKKEVFSLPVDIYLSNCYIVPSNSPHLSEDPFALIQQELSKIPTGAGRLTFLDANAHTNDTLDIHIECEGSEGPLEDLLPSEDSTDINLIRELFGNGLLGRVSTDKRPLNAHGRDFIDMCRSSNMLIMNGRIPGNDFRIGACTHYNPDGTSGLLDYAICSPNLFELFSNFHVHSKFPESDHCPISVEFPIDMSGNSPPKSANPNTGIKWEPCETFVWDKNQLTDLNITLENSKSTMEYNKFIATLSNNEDSDAVAQSFNSFFIKACRKVFKSKKSKKVKMTKYRRLKFFDSECREKRIAAIQAGERVETDVDRNILIEKCKEYKACLQRKKRKSKMNRKNNLVKIFKKDASAIWAELNKLEPNSIDIEHRDKFLHHFETLGKTPDGQKFDDIYLQEVELFLKEYDCSQSNNNILDSNISYILNQNFTIEEVEHSIDCLKSKKSPGTDSIPAEFIRYCKNTISSDLQNMFNFILEKREFPKSWAEGLKSAVFKSGLRNNPNNYRGITILGVFAKIFEILVSNRFQFVNEALNKMDPNNGGFLKGKRTSDNIFILHSIIQRQLTLNKSLYVCFVDFSKAFDLVNRAILFYKLINSGWEGRLLDTVRDLYSKTSFRFKFQGECSSAIPTDIGVNQGGNASGFLFRKYLSDLGDFLNKEFGVCLGDTVLAHLLWADDLILFSDSLKGIQKQLDGLYKFCCKNRMVVNELKTKMMVFGCGKKGDVSFNGKVLEWVEKYKYLGNIISSIKRVNGDVFKENAEYLCDKARKAIFAFYRKTHSYGVLPPDLLVSAYHTLIEPILLYGSDIWGISSKMCESIDKVCLFFLRYILGVKSTTSKLSCLGELGVIPPSVKAKNNCMKFYVRINNLSYSQLEKCVLNDLCDFDSVSFVNSTTKVKGIALSHCLNIDELSYSPEVMKCMKYIVNSDFLNSWLCNIINNTSSLRTYKLYKSQFEIEPYLLHVLNDTHRKSLSKFRCSSHLLEIERARHQPRVPPLWERVCPHCEHAVDDEIHLLLFCKCNLELRNRFMVDIEPFIPNLAAMHFMDKFTSIMSSTNSNVLNKLAKFVHESFKTRNLI